VRKKVKRFLRLTGLCLAALALGEIAARMFDLGPELLTSIGTFRLVENAEIVYELVPGSTVDGGIVNKQGFRGVDFRVAKPPGCVRIVMIGDSITQGLYVHPDKVFSRTLESYLNRYGKRRPGLKYEVLNFGVSGYNMAAEIATLKTKALQYHPDIVALNFFHNDNEPIPGLVMLTDDQTFDDRQKAQLLHRYGPQPGLLLKGFTRRLVHRSRLYWALFSTLGNSRKRAAEARSFVKTHYYANYPPAQIGKTLQFLSELEQLAKEHRFKVVICIHSNLMHSEHPNAGTFAELVRAFGFPWFRAMPYYELEVDAPEDLQISSTDICHPNERGHEIIARMFLAELQKNDLVEIR
jgi:lysophospholipase L1-like esterase